MGTPFKKDLYEKLVEAYRVEPGNKTRAAKYAGCSIPTARKAWEHGWKGRVDGIAIKDFFYREQEEARAARWKAEQDRIVEETERTVLARRDAEQARREEAVASKGSRRMAMNIGIVATKLSMLVDQMTGELQKRVAANLGQMTMEEMRKWMSTASIIGVRAQTVLRLALEIERVVVGEPTSVLAVKVSAATPDEMVREFSALKRIMERSGYLGDDATPVLSPDGSDDGSNTKIN